MTTILCAGHVIIYYDYTTSTSDETELSSTWTGDLEIIDFDYYNFLKYYVKGDSPDQIQEAVVEVKKSKKIIIPKSFIYINKKYHNRQLFSKSGFIAAKGRKRKGDINGR